MIFAGQGANHFFLPIRRHFQQHLDRPARRRAGKCRGDVHGGAEACAAVEPEAALGIHRRAHAAHAAVGLRIAHVLQRIHRRYAKIAIRVARKAKFPPQFLADQTQQLVVFGVGQIAYAQLGRINAATSGADHNQRLFHAPAARSVPV